MSALTNLARIKLTKLLHDSPLHVGWGTGDADWGTDKEVTSQFAPLTNQLDVGYPFISGVSVRLAEAPNTEYDLDVDFSVNQQTGVLTRLVTGAIPLGQNVVVSFHVDTEPESVAATALRGEVGRRLVTTKGFAVLDSEGDIVVESGTFSLSPGNAPTNHLFIEVAFLPSEASAALVREIGVFSDTVLVAGLPGGQQYFTPAQVQDIGKLLTLHHFPVITRNATSRETFRVVITL